MPIEIPGLGSVACPTSINNDVLELCREICSTTTPKFLRIEPNEKYEPGECFKNVARHVHSNGGSAVFGWQIWEIPGKFIEGEFHSVWKAPDGELHCVTPRTDQETQILFLEDPARTYKNEPVGNIRKSLNNSALGSILKEKGDRYFNNKAIHYDKSIGKFMIPLSVEIDNELFLLRKLKEASGIPNNDIPTGVIEFVDAIESSLGSLDSIDPRTIHQQMSEQKSAYEAEEEKALKEVFDSSVQQFNHVFLKFSGLKLLRRINEVMSKRLDNYIHDSPARKSHECKRGCSYCCHVPVELNWYEAVRIGVHLQEKLSGNDLIKLREECQTRSSIYLRNKVEYVKNRVGCALLNNEKECSIYDSRPFLCRQYLSTDVLNCKNSFENDEFHDAASVDHYVFTRGSVTGGGLLSAIDENGGFTGIYELHTALARLLQVSNLKEVIMNGENPLIDVPIVPGPEGH